MFNSKLIVGVAMLCLLFSENIHAQNSNKATLVLNKGVIQDELHQNNVGKIAFMESFIPYSDFTQDDFKDNITLSDGSEINMRFFLNKSLTYYLKQLAPTLEVEQLCEVGNFLFTFSVDGSKVSDIKIPYGAGSCEYKNSQTVYGVPLSNKTTIDHWGSFLWQKFLFAHGGDDALTIGTNILKVEIKPYIDFPETKVGEAIAEGSVTIERKPISVSPEEIEIQKIQKSEWQISTEEYNKDLIREMNSKILQKSFKDITSVIVVKQNKLLLEEYFNGVKRNSMHDVRSLTKSFTSTLVGAAINQGYIKDKNETLASFYNMEEYENYSPLKREITIEDLLTMSSCFAGNDMNPESPGNEENMYPTSNWVNFVLNLPTQENCQNKWQYFTGGVVLLGDILEQKTPEGLKKFADKSLFKPLGIKKVNWQYTPQNVPNTAGSCQLRSLDYIKFGQMYLNNGEWNGTSILSKEWVDQSLQHHKNISGEDDNYGYLFWNKKFEVNSKKYEAYTASGNGGNHLIVIKELDLVLLITATAYNRPYAHRQVQNIVEEYLLPAILN